MSTEHGRVPDRLLSVAELATYLGVSQMSIYLWRKKGVIPATRLGTRSLRFDVCEVLAALRRQAAEADKQKAVAAGANDEKK